MSTGNPKQIINLSNHSFTDVSGKSGKKGRRFSNINTQAVIYKNEQLEQLYTGLYLDENLHNIGTYRWLSDKGSHKYEGKLFLNNLHGYGKLLYPNDVLFEGLFYFNKKFGPGVVTYNDENQDVGLWNGNFLIRLCDKFSISDFYKEHIPKLSGLMESKLYLLQFKHLIPIAEKYKDPAADILKELGATDDFLTKKHMLYSKYIRNPRSMFSNSEKLYKNFFTYVDELHTTVDVVDHFDEDDKPVMTKLDVCNLVAWNNEEINVDILKHAFLNRHHEKLLSYKIKDVLCTNKRGNFLPPGPIETKSRELLFACRSTDSTPVRRLITEYDLYPDLADCKGNNTVTYATLANQIEVIKVLSEFGANLNNFNDDGITPLIFAILQYISIKYEINTLLWEPAFIYTKIKNNLPPCNQQWPTNSPSSTTSISLNNFLTSSGKSLNAISGSSVNKKSQLDMDNSQSNINFSIPNIGEQERRQSLVSLVKEYVLSLDCLRSKRTSNIRKTIVDSNVKYRRSSEYSDSVITYDNFKTEELQKISQIISTLLLCGADPNIGEIPFCPIITAIFSRSKDLIQMLISFNVNVNAKTCEHFGNLGPLHVIASLSPCLELLEMAFEFLENGAYIDDYTNKIHWIEEQNILLAERVPQDYLEKTPLHLVCMRYDFHDDINNYLTKLALMFMEYGANVNLKYLGHTPLTLAMMRGNIKLIESLLETGLVDPNEGLGYNMGVPLTVCILNRYSKLLTLNTARQIYPILMDFYANPFNDVPNFNGNAIEFYYREQYLQQASKRQSINKANINAFLLINCAKSTLLKYIESKVVQTLYHYKIVCDFDSGLYNNIVKYLNYENTLEILQILIDHKKIAYNEFNIKKLMQFVIKKEPTEKIKFTKNDQNYMKSHFINSMPEIDPDELKYEVCFECFRKTNEILMLCPKCELVYFCSNECNMKNLKDPDSAHPCKGDFYDQEMLYTRTHRKRSTKFDQLIDRSSQLMKLLSFGNIKLEDFAGMALKDRKKSIAKIKLKQKIQLLNEINAAEEAGSVEGKSKIKKATDIKKKRTSATNEKQVSHEDKMTLEKDKRTIEKGLLSGAGTKSEKSSSFTVKSDSRSLKSSQLRSDTLSKRSKAKSSSSSGKKTMRSEKSSIKDYDMELELIKSEDGISEKDNMKSQVKSSKYLDKTKQKGKNKGLKRFSKNKASKIGYELESKLLKSGMKATRTKDKKITTKEGGKFGMTNIGSRIPQKGTRFDKTERSGKSSKTSRSKPSTVTDFGEKKHHKLNLPFKRRILQGAGSAKDRLSVFIGSKKPVINMNKRNRYLILKDQMKERDRELNARTRLSVQSQLLQEHLQNLQIDTSCTERMLQLARKNIPNFPNDYEELDMKFWQTFTPFCLFQNGQLYYNFNDDSSDVFYKITSYSTM